MTTKVCVCRQGLRQDIQRGFTLIELMVSAAIGLMLLVGIATIFVNSSRARDEIQRQSEQIDNGRYAVELLNNEFHTAGYLGELNPNTSLLPPVLTKPDPCVTDDASLTTALPQSVQGYDNGATTLTCLSDVKPGTDVLVVRRASSCAVGEPGCDGVVAGVPYFQASACNSTAEIGAVASPATASSFFRVSADTTTLTLHSKDCTTVAPLRRLRTHIFFVANNDKIGDGIPTLKRAELRTTGFTIVPLVEGIDDLQIEYGLDAGIIAGGSAAGVVGAYTANPDSFNTCLPDICQKYWRNVIAVKVNILARSNTGTAGYSDSKIYTLGKTAAGATNSVGPIGDAYKRHLYSTTVSLFNVAGRNTP